MLSVLLDRASQGDQDAQSELFEKVERELEVIARGLLRRVLPGHVNGHRVECVRHACFR